MQHRIIEQLTHPQACKPPPQRSPLERLRARLHRMESFAFQSDHFTDIYRDRLPAAELQFYEEEFRQVYQQIVGVHPLKRHQLKTHLDAFIIQGHQAIDDAEEDIRQLLLKCVCMQDDA